MFHYHYNKDNDQDRVTIKDEKKNIHYKCSFKKVKDNIIESCDKKPNKQILAEIIAHLEICYSDIPSKKRRMIRKLK